MSVGDVAITLSKKKNDLLQEVNIFGDNKIVRLRRVNQGWNIGLTVNAITCTTIATALGVIDIPGYEGWVKFGVALTGATAVATQTASREFRIKGKAGEYAETEAELSILKYKIPRAPGDNTLKDLEEDFHKLRRAVADIESQDNGE